jgi:3-carboxymuconate cyclase
MFFSFRSRPALASRTFLALCALGAALSVSGCRSPTGPASTAAKAAQVKLSFGGCAAKGFAPADLAVARCRVAATGPEGKKASAEAGKGESVTLELMPGSWSIVVSGLAQSGVEIARGSLDIVLASGETKAETIALLPVDGSGSVTLSWTIVGDNGGTLTVEGALKGPGGRSVAIAAPASSASLRFSDLAAGSWKLELRLLKDGAALCGLAESVFVAASLDTAAAVVFQPPEATVGLKFALPDFSARSLALRPAKRRVAAGRTALFRASLPGASGFAWYRDGLALSAAGASAGVAAEAVGNCRIDCLETGTTGSAASGCARLVSGKVFSFAPFSWVETIAKQDDDSGSSYYCRALGDPRDLAFSPDGSYLALASKDSDSLALFELPAPGSGGAFYLSSLGGSAEPRLLSPDKLAFMDSGRIVATSSAKAAVYAASLTGTGLALTATLSDPLLAGAADLAVLPGGSLAVAASTANALALVSFDASGAPASVAELAGAATPGLESLSCPSCLALSAAGDALAMGSSGDDALYLFSVSGLGGEARLALKGRVAAAAFASLGSFSNPCDLAFSPDGASLFVLATKAVFRLDRDSSGSFVPVAAAKSGLSGVAGFSTAKQLALVAGGTRLAIVGSGAEDGLALFDVGGAGKLGFLGCRLPDSASGAIGQDSLGDALAARAASLCSSGGGGFAAVGAPDRLVFYELSGQ